MASIGRLDTYQAIAELTKNLFPGTRLISVEALGPDTSRASTEKVGGYSLPLKIALQDGDGSQRYLVFRTATPNEFGHDRRSDRAQAMLLSYDTFGEVPNHVQAVDVGAIMADGGLRSLRGSGEFYLLTSFAEGNLYSEDLRRIAQQGRTDPMDEKRCRALSNYLVNLHSTRFSDGQSYRRAVRDLIGHGEGIFGIVDSYPSGVPAAPLSRLNRIEEICLTWRWRLRGRENRLRRTHGDFHPFNIVFGEGTQFTALDASRGCRGDPADDVTALAINYIFFALDSPGAWERGLGHLWRTFWSSYLESSTDSQLLQVAAPFLAWRGLVLSNPRFYPGLSKGARDSLLALVERALGEGEFDPAFAEDIFR
jgi:hypothetical protein